MTKIAMCTVCHEEPLVMTFAFYRKEFICLKCGRLFEFLEPDSAKETPFRLARMNERKREWVDNAGPMLIVSESYNTDCIECASREGGYHREHATDDEWAAHERAIEWIKERTGKEVYVA